MTAYYNEIDPFAAQWLRELIKAGHIADGIVDERSIEDVTKSDLNGFTQCHFFAGIGVWSYALRQAGWSDDRPVWTGSCPCQPFSTAGKGAGFADERHLWPAFHWLIDQCGPDIVFGEQVAGKDGLSWLDLVCTDLENSRYTCGAAVTAACGFGAPHQRKRLYWVANSKNQRYFARKVGDQDGAKRPDAGGREDERLRVSCAAGASGIGGLAKSDCQRRKELNALLWQKQIDHSETAGGSEVDGMANSTHQQHDWSRNELPGRWSEHPDRCATRRMANPCGTGLEGRSQQSARAEQPPVERSGDVDRPGPTNGFWRDADWLGCRDGKWRPVEPSTFPLANGASARVGRLRGYGNAICAQQAEAFIEAVMASLLPN